MKKILISIAIVLLLCACTSQEGKTESTERIITEYETTNWGESIKIITETNTNAKFIIVRYSNSVAITKMN